MKRIMLITLHIFFTIVLTSCENGDNQKSNMNYKIWASECANHTKSLSCSSDIDRLISFFSTEKFNSLFDSITEQKANGDVYIIAYADEGEIYIEKLLMICSNNNTFSSYSITNELGELKVLKVNKKMDNASQKLLEELDLIFNSKDSASDKYPFPNLITRINKDKIDVRISCSH